MMSDSETGQPVGSNPFRGIWIWSLKHWGAPARSKLRVSNACSLCHLYGTHTHLSYSVSWKSRELYMHYFICIVLGLRVILNQLINTSNMIMPRCYYFSKFPLNLTVIKSLFKFSLKVYFTVSANVKKYLIIKRLQSECKIWGWGMKTAPFSTC